MSKLFEKYSRTAAGYMLAFSIVLPLIPAPVFAQTPPPAPNGGAGFAGKVASVDAANNSFNAEVRLVYAGAAKWGGIGGVLPPGRIVIVRVPAGTVLKDLRGNIITLSQVTVGSLFNAAVTIDTSVKPPVITGKTIVFLIGTTPPPPPTSPTPTPPGWTPTPTPNPSGTPPVAPNGGAGFAGKVASVDVANNLFNAEVRLVYAGAAKYGGFGGILPPGRIVIVRIPAGTVLKDLRGNVITLSQVTVGSLFNAAVTIDSTVKPAIITGKTIVFLIGTTPPPPPTSPTPTPPGWTPTPTPPGWTPTPTPIPTPTGPEAAVNFAGKVESVDAANNKAVVTVRLVYGGVKGGFFGGMVLPGTKITVTVPPTVPITRLGVAITLADVVAGDLFNARATIDKAAHTGIASSIQVITPSLKEVIFAGTITAVATAEPKSITIRNGVGVEQPFTIAATTQIFIGTAPATIADLKVGSSAALTFITVGGVKQAVKISQATTQFQGRIDKFFATENVQRRLDHAVQILEASLDRFDTIIAKQETAITDLKAAGKNTAKAETLLATSKTDQAAARTSLADTKVKVAVISTSPDPKTAAEAARVSMGLTIDAAKKVFTDIKATQTEIKLLSPTPTPTPIPSSTPTPTP